MLAIGRLKREPWSTILRLAPRLSVAVYSTAADKYVNAVWMYVPLLTAFYQPKVLCHSTLYVDL